MLIILSYRYNNHIIIITNTVNGKVCVSLLLLCVKTAAPILMKFVEEVGDTTTWINTKATFYPLESVCKCLLIFHVQIWVAICT